MSLETNLSDVRQRIRQACVRSGRDPQDVQLIAVTKTMPPEVIQAAYDLGVRRFGENRAQEFRDKIGRLPGDIEWHFIGHLQSNKIKYVAGKVALIQSVDSVELAQALSDFAVKKNITQAILLEVKTSPEATKYGVPPEQAEAVFMQIRELPNIFLKGLMTIAPFTDNEVSVRKSFRQLRELRDALASRVSDREVAVLSMGMSHDFEIAIEEGSTMVRIGTSIFGARRR